MELSSVSFLVVALPIVIAAVTWPNLKSPDPPRNMSSHMAAASIEVPLRNEIAKPERQNDID